MRTLLEILEICSTASFVTGFTLNLLLLYLIRRFSTKELGTYKYLLETFAGYDTYLVVVHHIINPKAIPSPTGFSFISDRDFGTTALSCFYSSCYAVPFVSLNIHLLYRYWTIHAPHNIVLFTRTKFVATFLGCYILGLPENDDEIRKYQSLFHQEYQRNITEGLFIAEFWRDGHLSIRPFLLLLIADSVEIATFSLAATLATLTYREIRKAQNISDKIRHFQLQILVAASAQTLTPFLLVYVPYFLSLTIPFFGLHSPVFSALSMLLLSLFPCVDAIIIVLLMRPYREGLMRMLGKKEVRPIKNGASFTTSTVSVNIVA